MITFTEEQLLRLQKGFAPIMRVSAAHGDQILRTMEKMPVDLLLQLRGAGISFISILADTQLRKRLEIRSY